MREEKITFRERIIKHRLTRIYRVVLCIVLVAAVIAVIHIQIENRIFSGYEVIRTAEGIGASNSTLVPYNGNVICYSRDGISAYSAKGEQLWNQTYEMQAPIVDVAGNCAVAGDYKGNVIYVMGETGLCSEIATSKVILSLTVSKQGVVTAVLDDDTITLLSIYTSQGEEIVSIKTSMNQTGFPLRVSMSDDNKKLAVSYLKTNGNGIGSSIAFYNFGDVGQNVTDKIVSGYDYKDSVIPFLHYLNANEAVAVGEKQILVFSGKQIPELKAEKEIEEGVESIFYGDTMLALLYRNEEGEDRYRMDVYDLNAGLLFSKTFDMEYSNVILKNETVTIYNEAGVLIWNRKGLEKYNGDMGGNIRAVIPTNSETKYIVIRDESLETVKLK